jgi:hypothetical protein
MFLKGDQHFRFVARLKITFVCKMCIAHCFTDTGWWLQLAHTVDLSLRREGFVVRHHVVLLDISMSVETLTAKLEPLKTAPCRGKYILNRLTDHLFRIKKSNLQSLIPFSECRHRSYICSS